jgi:hypothetical protein
LKKQIKVTTDPDGFMECSVDGVYFVIFKHESGDAAHVTMKCADGSVIGSNIGSDVVFKDAENGHVRASVLKAALKEALRIDLEASEGAMKTAKKNLDLSLQYAGFAKATRRAIRVLDSMNVKE